jgi:superoxide dismutase
MIDSPANIKVPEPQGKLKDYIERAFTDVQGLKEALAKAVLARVLPGWVWVGLTTQEKEPRLIIT